MIKQNGLQIKPWSNRMVFK